MFKVPELMPSLTKKIIFFAFLFFLNVSKSNSCDAPLNGVRIVEPIAKSELFLKNFLLSISVLIILCKCKKHF